MLSRSVVHYVLFPKRKTYNTKTAEMTVPAMCIKTRKMSRLYYESACVGDTCGIKIPAFLLKGTC